MAKPLDFAGIREFYKEKRNLPENTDDMHDSLPATPIYDMPDTLKRTDEDIYDAVNAWCDPNDKDHKLAIAKYGPISEWDTSDVTNMSSLFQDKTKFNDDITQWDVSNVTNMDNMFDNAQKFNQDLSRWNVSKVKRKADVFVGSGMPLYGVDRRRHPKWVESGFAGWFGRRGGANRHG